jgi:hypothetical protein
MPSPIVLKIDVKKLKKEWFFTANSGAVYADLVLYANDEPDKYENTHAIKQNPPKEARDRGEKGHYVGNGKAMQSRGGQSQAAPAASGYRKANIPPSQTGGGDMEESDIPF